MTKEHVKFTCRMARTDVDQINQNVAQYGFGTRSKYLTAAGLNYGQTGQPDNVMAQLAEINFVLHHLSQVDRKGVSRVPPADAKALVREARKLMTAVRANLQ